jgi:hypothetical protein
MALTMKAWFRALAAAMKSEATAQAIAGISVLVLVLYTGYGEYQMAKVYIVLTFCLESYPAAINDRSSTLDHLR